MTTAAPGSSTRGQTRGAVVLMALCACSQHAAQIAKQPEVSALDKLEGAKCSLASLQPLVVDWSPTRRGALESALRAGTLVVKYTGCKLEILDRCRPAAREARYAYVPVNPKHEGHSFKTADDLYAQMPAGAARLEGALRSSGELRLEMDVVGRFESGLAEVKSNELDGAACEDATHAVKAVSVGAFRLFSAASAMESGSVTAGPAGTVRSSGSAEKESLSEDGKPDACSKATSTDSAPPDGCAAFIRVELVPIKAATSTAVVKSDRVCPAGMTVAPEGFCKKDQGASSVEQSPRGAVSTASQGRFVPADETVFDTTTGLTWQRAPAGQRMSWDQAKAYCRGLTLAANAGWRLPKRSELETLVARRTAPTIDPTVFPSTPPEPFWTFAADKESAGDAIAIDFSTGRWTSLGSGTQRSVRCVR